MNQLLYQAEKGGSGSLTYDDEDIDVPAGAQASTTIPQRKNNPPIDDINRFSIIKGVPLQEIGRIITSHLKSKNQEPFLDRNALALGIKRKLISLYIPDNLKNNQPFKDYGDKFGKLPEIVKGWTIGELIARQFQKSVRMVKALNVQAEFFKKKIKLPNGYAECRLFQYNTGGFVTCEYREYEDVVELANTIGPATMPNGGKAPEYADEEFSVEDNTPAPPTPPAKGKAQV